MSDNELQSFKVGAKQPTGVRQHSKAPPSGKQSAPAEPPTLGFQRIETILDKEQPSAVQQRMGALADALDAVAASAAPAKDKANAKRAKLAVTRTVELLAYLFATKEQMLKAYMENQSSEKPKGKAAPVKGSKGGR